MRKIWESALDDNPEEWVCDCGEKLNLFDGNWRWDGKYWQHYHGYPIGHVIVKRKKKENQEVTGENEQ